MQSVFYFRQGKYPVGGSGYLYVREIPDLYKVLCMKTKRTGKEKPEKPGKAESDYKLIIVLGTALLLAILMICAVMLTTPS